MKNEKLIIGSIGVLLAGVIALFVMVFTKAEKIAYIDTAKLLSGYPEMQSVKKKLEEEAGKAKANVDTLTMEFQSSLKEYEKGMSKMSPKEKALSEELLRGKQNQLMQYQQALEQKLKGDEQKQTQAILANINAFITEYGKKHNYKIILATSGGNIAYGDKGADITEEILKGLGKE
jgi:outer membrane protein